MSSCPKGMWIWWAARVPQALPAGRVSLRISSASKEASGLLGAILQLSPTFSERQAMQIHPKVRT